MKKKPFWVNVTATFTLLIEAKDAETAENIVRAIVEQGAPSNEYEWHEKTVQSIKATERQSE